MVIGSELDVDYSVGGIERGQGLREALCLFVNSTLALQSAGSSGVRDSEKLYA